MYKTIFSQISFLFSSFFRKNMAFESVFSFDFTTTSKHESLLCTGFCFHFWHLLFFLKVCSISASLVLFFAETLHATFQQKIKTYFFLGFNMIIIRFPSNFGIASNAPKSASSLANFNNNNSPLSLNTIVLPRKKT